MDSTNQPLAARMRPHHLAQFIGQEHILGPGKPLYEAIVHGRLHSVVLWGPPGTGKTTLARLLAAHSNAEFISLSAVLAGVKDIRAAVEDARQRREQEQRATLLFVDEVHRFNKAQQDAFLPHIEDGAILFAGATTENPSFELNNALLSRLRVYVLKPLTIADIAKLVRTAIADAENGLGGSGTCMEESTIERLARLADGDARRALTMLEIASDMADGQHITDEILDEVMRGPNPRRFDKGGDVFYDQISALHKSVRGSDPDAALYWFCRMIDGGADAHYIARRVVRMASEDIGNADPRALQLALDGWTAYERLGSPEGELAIAQAVVYLAIAAKSNAVYKGYKAAMDAAQQSGSLEVPVHLRNAPTSLLKKLGHGRDYRYAHDEAEGYAAGETYLPESIAGQRFYLPVDRGLESRIREKLEQLRQRDKRQKPDDR